MSPSPVYHVRVSPSAAVSCTCPAFVWDRQRGQAKNTPPDQLPPSCKHCEALQAAGLLPVAFVQLLAERTTLLDKAEETVKHRDKEREAACRNADSLHSHIAHWKHSFEPSRGGPCSYKPPWTPRWPPSPGMPQPEGRSMTRRQPSAEEQDRRAILAAAGRLIGAGRGELVVIVIRGDVITIRPEPPPAAPGSFPADMGKYDRDILRALADRPLS